MYGVMILQDLSEIRGKQLAMNSEDQLDGQEMEPEAESASASKPAKTDKPLENKVVKLLEKNPLGMTLPEMAGGPRQMKKIRTLRPVLAEAIKLGLVMPVSQRAGHTVYRLVKSLGPR
jgi:hypothetical protein